MQVFKKVKWGFALFYLFFTALELFSYEVSTKHFRVLSGKDEPYFIDVAKRVANYAEYAYSKETKFFRSPNNNNRIDIFLANTALTHPDVGDINLPLNIAGYHALDDNNQTFLVINPYLTDDRFKTITAHELFHVIQYGYYNFSKKSEKWWKDNLWWIESTAVWAENLVYPELKSYIPFANYYVKHHCEDIRTRDMMSEYSKVLIPMLINNPKIIAQSFENVDKYRNFTNFLNKKFGLDRLLFLVANKKFDGVDEFEEKDCEKLGYYGFDISYVKSFTGANLLFDIFKYKDRYIAISKVSDLDNPLFYNEKEDYYTNSGWNFLVNLSEREIKKDAYVYKNYKLVKTDRVKPLQGYWIYFKDLKKPKWNQINIDRVVNNSFGSLKIKSTELSKKFKNITILQYDNGWKKIKIKNGKILENQMDFINPFLGVVYK